MSLATQPLAVYIEAFLGAPDYSHQTLITFTSASTATAAVQQSTLLTVNANTTDLSFNLASYFPGISNCQFVVIQDVTNPGQPFSVGSNAGGRFSVQASSPMCWMQNGGNPPIIYLTNPSSTTASSILVSVASL